MKAAENIAQLYRDDRKKNIFCTSAGNSQTRRKGKEKEKVPGKIGKGKTCTPANQDQLKKEGLRLRYQTGGTVTGAGASR